MKNAPPPIEVSENHRRSISVTLHLLDKELCQWEQWLENPPPPGVMYQQQDTLTAAEKKELRRRISLLREGIIQVRDRLGLQPARPETARLIVGQANLVWEMLAELNSSTLAGYGTVTPALAEYINPIGESLTRQMHEISILSSGEKQTGQTDGGIA